MALKDQIAFGMSLPHRSPDPIDMSAVRQVAQRADALGFRDLWVTENTLDHVFCFDPIVILTYAAAVTTSIRARRRRSSCCPSTIPSIVAHKVADARLRQQRPRDPRRGAGPRPPLRAVPDPARAPRAALPRGRGADQGAVDASRRSNYRGSIYQLEDGTMAPKPVQKPHPPIWLGGGHPDALTPRRDDRRRLDGLGRLEHGRLRAERSRRYARRSRRPGATRRRSRSRSACSCRCTSAPTWRRPSCTTGSRPSITTPNGADASGVHGTPEQVRERLEELVAHGRQPSPAQSRLPPRRAIGGAGQDRRAVLTYPKAPSRTA